MASEATGLRTRGMPPLTLPVISISVSALVVVAFPVDHVAFPFLVAWLVGWLTLPIAGAVLLDADPGDRVGVVLSMAGLSPAAATLVMGEQGIGPAVVASYVGAPAVALLGVGLLLCFPTDVPGRAARALAGVAVALALAATAAGVLARYAGTPTPRPWAFGGLATAVVGIAAFGLAARHWLRLLPPDRDRRGWVLLGSVVWWAVIAVAVSAGTGTATWPGVTYVLAGLTCAGAAGIVTLRLAREPLPLDLALARVGATVLAVGGVTLTYLTAVGLLAQVGLPESRVAAAVLAALTAVALFPLWALARDRLTTRAFGLGRTPGAMLADLGRRMAQPLDQQDLLDSLADGVATAVRSPGVTITLEGEDDGSPPEDGSTVVPLTWAGDRVGRLRVRPRRPGERFRGRDLRLISQLATTVAAVAASAALGRRLEASEVSRLEAASRERAGIRRDLHDDLGPLLAGIGMRLAAATASLPEEGPTAVSVRRHLEAAVGGVEDSRSAVRRLVDALAPEGPHGLPAGVAAVVADWSDAAAGRPAFRSEIDPDATLPPAGTATMLRILGEAVTNVVRHAEAGTCVVRLSRRGAEVVLDVLDDGVGGAAVNGIGVGTSSMRERAEELGGRLRITAVEPRGTHVQAVIPVGEPA